MGGCNFIDVLNRLKKSSSDSIDNANTEFDDFKTYMHVERAAEKALKDLLGDVNRQGKKTLILLCGSAGDGKSHLLAHLKYDSERLLDGYRIHNDATESNAQHKTAIDTLNEVLSDFNDENLDKPDGKNFILAINLGVLANFIESKYGDNYTKLKNYVDDEYILSSKVNKKIYKENSHFQHISFSDYQMFLLEKDGINPEYIESLFEKIILKDDNNQFYLSYNSKCSNCSLFPSGMNCPVKKNYEFFMDEKVRKYIASLLVNVIIQDKEILTTRELLNYVHDIIVPQNFSISNYQKSIGNNAKFLKEYLSDIMPTILFDCKDISSIMNKTHKFDPLLDRDQIADNLTIEYYVADNVSTVLNELLVDSPYVEFRDEETIRTINSDRLLKPKFFKVLVRTKAISKGFVPNDSFKEYVNYLFSYNAGKVGKGSDLRYLYDDVEKAVLKWCGDDKKGIICIDDQHTEFALYEKIDFEPDLSNLPEESDLEIFERFLPYIIIEFKNRDNKPSIKLDVDYSLYELVERLKKGYIQTAEDRNNHADFISFISKILKTGSAKECIIAISEKGLSAEIEKTTFGEYKFGVAK